jgi:hypothetical protein
MGIDAVEKDMLLILDHTDRRWGNCFDSMSLSQNVGCEHEV